MNYHLAIVVLFFGFLIEDLVHTDGKYITWNIEYLICVPNTLYTIYIFLKFLWLFLETDTVQKCNRIKFNALGSSPVTKNAWFRKFVFQTFHFKSLDGRGNDVYHRHIVDGIKLDPILYLCKFTYSKDDQYWGVRMRKHEIL